MTSAALVPLAFLALTILFAVFVISRLFPIRKDEDDKDFAWLPISENLSTSPQTLTSSETYAIPPAVAASEPPPTAEVIRMPVRLYVVQGGRR